MPQHRLWWCAWCSSRVLLWQAALRLYGIGFHLWVWSYFPIDVRLYLLSTIQLLRKFSHGSSLLKKVYGGSEGNRENMFYKLPTIWLEWTLALQWIKFLPAIKYHELQDIMAQNIIVYRKVIKAFIKKVKAWALLVSSVHETSLMIVPHVCIYSRETKALRNKAILYHDTVYVQRTLSVDMQPLWNNSLHSHSGEGKPN
jgi:hypothetical protein